MGSCCTIRRPGQEKIHVNTSLTDDERSFLECKRRLFEDFISNNLNEQFLLDYLNVTIREENFDLIVELIDNQSEVALSEDILKSLDWINHPKTYGELALYETLKLIKIKVEQEVITFKTNYQTFEKSEDFANLDDYEEYYLKFIYSSQNEICKKIEKSNFIDKMLTLLSSRSDSKKDIAILILSYLSNYKVVNRLMHKDDVIYDIFLHIESFRHYKYKNFKRHIVASFLILRNIFVSNIDLREYFIEIGGLELLKEFLFCGDIDIVREVTLNIQDLIYKDTNEKYLFTSYSKMLIPEVLELLKINNFKKALVDFYFETLLKKKEKYSCVEEDIKLLITIFSDEYNQVFKSL